MLYIIISWSALSCFLPNLVFGFPIYSIATIKVVTPYYVQPSVGSSLDGNIFNSRFADDWDDRCARLLAEEGIVCLVGEDNRDGVIPKSICERASNEINKRVSLLKEKIECRGVDSRGVNAPFRFMEIVSRDEGGNRFDVTVPWKGEGDSIGTELTPECKKAIFDLHSSIDTVVENAISKLWPNSMFGVISSGFLVNEPGSQSQNFHRDGPDEGFLDVFVPISVDLRKEHGPTACIPRSHTSDCDELDTAIEPLMKKGEILMFDYRYVCGLSGRVLETIRRVQVGSIPKYLFHRQFFLLCYRLLHRGQGNTSDSTRTLAYVVYQKGATTSKHGDLRNFPSALTLEYD